MSDKIKPHHLEPKAMLYVRQSWAYQVAHNRESRQLQYAMQSRLGELGWRGAELLDEDLGRSATDTTQHPAATCVTDIEALLPFKDENDSNTDPAENSTPVVE